MTGSGSTRGDESAGRPHDALDINAVFRSGGRSVEFLERINRASIVMLAETGIVPHAVAADIARAIAAVHDAERSAAPRRSADYLDYEPRLLAAAGPAGSRLHTGRSRQDIASTVARMNLRDGLLKAFDALLGVRARLIARAGEHVQTIVPAYTHGVQAQPTTFGHYLAAFDAALERQSERLRQACARINRCPLGAAALGTSSFPLDRQRLADLLGFEGMIENAYDANHLAPIDAFLDVAGALAIAAVEAGQFAQDIHAQYDDPKPWIMLAAGELTGVSSIMPQKRNPAALEQLRAQASLLLGEMQAVYLLAHNVRTGMFDYRMYDPVPCARGIAVLTLFRQIVDGIVVDRARALAEVHADYSTTTEIADRLLVEADVPFRNGHHFASKLTDFGRSRGIRLGDIAFEDVGRIYREEAGQPFPLSEAQYREAISPEYMVFSRRGRGGPQLNEVARMLSEAATSLEADREWLDRQRRAQAAADARLDAAFAALAGRASPDGD